MATNNSTNNWSPLTTKGDLFTYDTAPQRLGVGSNSKMVISDSTQTTGLNYDYPALDISYCYNNFNDFLITTGTSTESTWFVNTSGTGAAASPTSSFVTDGSRLGVMVLQSGTTTTGTAGVRTANYVYQGNGQILFETPVYLDQLSNGTDTFTINSGILPANSGLNQTNSLYFNYNDTTNSGKFQCVTNASGVTTTADSGISVSASTWYNLGILINANNTSVGFYINHSLVATITTHIPTAQLLFGASVLLKSAGTTNVFYRIDYIRVRKDFSSQR